MVPISFNTTALLAAFDCVLPDLILSFSLFMSLCYDVLSRRLFRARSAIVASVSIALALSLGLVWWEMQRGVSIRNLGPIATGFAIVIVGSVIFQAIRRVAGGYAGSLSAVGVALFVAWALEVGWPIKDSFIRIGAVVAIVFGIALIATRGRIRAGRFSVRRKELPRIRHDMSDLREDLGVARRLTGGFRRLRRHADQLTQRPEGVGDVMLQLKRMLPAEGWLTERLASLRETACRVRAGHIARIDELRQTIDAMSPQARKRAAWELKARHEQLKLDGRIERLDRSVAENERRVVEITRQAQRCARKYDYRALTGILESASKLQKHNAKLIRLIKRTEGRLLSVAKQVAREQSEVSDE